MPPRLLATRKHHQNASVADPWTVVHFAAGLAAGLMDLSFARVMAAAVAYEVVEQAFERHPVGQDFFRTSRPEHLLNAALDVGVFALGHALGTRWNRS